ncbi:MAG: hypothetical protein WBG69_02820 [Arcobacteraceae bacterium]
MQFIYIENYLTIPRDEKREFLALIGSFENARVTNQKIILNDKSLILEFEKNSDISFAKKAIDTFFKINQNISVKLVSQIVQEVNEIVLIFTNKKQKKVKL